TAALTRAAGGGFARAANVKQTHGDTLGHQLSDGIGVLLEKPLFPFLGQPYNYRPARSWLMHKLRGYQQHHGNMNVALNLEVNALEGPAPFHRDVLGRNFRRGISADRS